MPQLYPTKTPSKKVNFVSDGPSDIPRLVEDNPTDFLHSRYFHANIKEKSRLSLPPNFKSKEEFAKTAPEKQKPPTMSMFRRVQLEDIGDRGLMRAKNTRLFYYISQKFITKFGSAHKRCISAAVEDFLTDHQDDNIDINDLRVLDSIISDSIISRNGEDSGLRESISQGTYLNYDTKKSGLFDDTLHGSISTGTLDPLPLGPLWKIIRNHRSLTKQDRVKSEIDFKINSKIKLDSNLAEIAQPVDNMIKLVEIENYRPDNYMQECTKIYNDDEIDRQKRIHSKKVADYEHQEQLSKNLLSMKKEKFSRTQQEYDVEENRKSLESIARAIQYKEIIQSGLNNSVSKNSINSKYGDQSLKERLKENTNYRIHKKRSLPGAFKLSHKTFSGNMSTQEIRNQDSHEEQFQNTANMDDTGMMAMNNQPIISYKLSQQTFKKTVLQKQEDYRTDLRIQAIEQKKNLVDFHRPFGAGVSQDKNPDKIGNMPHATVNRGYAVGHMTLNKAYFINRDREKYSRSNSTL